MNGPKIKRLTVKITYIAEVNTGMSFSMLYPSTSTKYSGAHAEPLCSVSSNGPIASDAM